MIELTPYEFLTDNWREKVASGQYIVWCKSEPVHWVVPGKYGYELHQDNDSDYSRLTIVTPFELCLRVEDVSDRAALRQRIAAQWAKLIEQSDDSALLQMRYEIEQELALLKERARLRAKAEPD